MWGKGVTENYGVLYGDMLETATFRGVVLFSEVHLFEKVWDVVVWVWLYIRTGACFFRKKQ